MIEKPLKADVNKALGEYQLLYYNGHSEFGSKALFTDKSAFSSKYQVIAMHSCRSYSYYTRQIFRAKATTADPSGFAAADVLGTGESSYSTDSGMVLEHLLDGLMRGLAAVSRGEPEQAPSWRAIISPMNEQAYGIMYGAAGVRTNAWQPE